MDTRYAIVEYDSVSSTQDLAVSALHASGTPTLVTAARQTGGRGRSGRDWWQADRAVAASLAFRPDWSADALGLIPLLAGVAARRALAEVLGVTVGLKWPNDLVVAAGKAGGILSEAADGEVVVGCGVNLWWAEPPEGAAALLDHDPGAQVAPVFARTWAEHLLDLVALGPESWPHGEYHRACVTIGRAVSWDGGSGNAVGVGADGGLIVETGDGKVTLRSGEVRLGR